VSRFAIVVGRFYEELAEKLVASASDVFEQAGAEGVDVFDVPGAYEIPLAAKYCAESGRYAGVCALGAVIRGETSHYDHVVEECARGLMDVQLSTGVPCGFGVLTVESREQAEARAGGGKRDSGRAAAEAVLAMARMRSDLE
jgi:6,7-dimethyl-8-ribityllumazine synthase